MRAVDCIGEKTLEKAKKTKWWALARFLDGAIYAGGVHTEAKYSAWWRTSERIFVGENWAEHKNILGADGAYGETAKVLRELMHECERMAVKEVT